MLCIIHWMKIDGTLSELPGAAARARMLEGSGYDAAWAGEVNSGPFLSLSVAAEVTGRIQLGTSIAVAFARSPMTLAYTATGYPRGAMARRQKPVI
jgi:alkanesulfonate monooxygenase SsuD/methylene tetrahydromethanopterin reductase-like flavin-dependent oxidoreductase (luciferase family)